MLLVVSGAWTGQSRVLTPSVTAQAAHTGPGWEPCQLASITQRTPLPFIQASKLLLAYFGQCPHMATVRMREGGQSGTHLQSLHLGV